MITIALVVIMIALIFVLKSLIFDLSINHNFQVIDAVTFITSMLCISIYEELSFRGIIFEWLTEKLGINLSILLSSIIFSLFHITNNGFDFLSFLNVFLAGVFLSFLIFKSGSIIPSILFHFLWNISLPTFVDSSVSGFMYSNLIEFDSSSDIYFQLFFGDKFGIESGLVVTLLLILGIIVIAKYIKLSPYSEAVRLKKLYNTYN
ncbi:MAG TPA: CPBP family intramembrane metalloprotease [Candidatus Kapabacteria bacterium]|nr:CPBP family intramembrane metalloprotease [Candidatus Kapabacteria bacterium]